MTYVCEVKERDLHRSVSQTALRSSKHCHSKLQIPFHAKNFGAMIDHLGSLSGAGHNRRQLLLTGVAQQGGQKPHLDTKLVHSGQPQVFDNKQQAPLVVIMLFINTAASVINVCRSRADAHPVSQHDDIATSAVPEDVARPDFAPYASSSPQKRWHGGQVKTHMSAIGGLQGLPASGSKS